MKYLIVAAILGALLLILYLRLRPYINLARRMLGVLRQARSMSEGHTMPGVPPARPKKNSDEHLVRCASCGTWLPASRALTLRATSSNFCSHACMERSAGQSSTRRTANS
ncbi:MAG TPA: hypothetical protein VGW12_07465 [Pyrinomonadaceae bacterium]|nr:hypothetical protein [Pyrinomonadaceae bacterium]